MKEMNLNNLAFRGAWNGTRHILPFHSETRSLLYFTISYNKSIIAVSAARPSGWVEESSITASSRGDRRKSSPPQFSCCSWKISCTWSIGFLQPAGDSKNGSSWARGRNQQEHTSKLKNAWKSMFGKRSCYMVLNRSSERIPQFQWKTPEESYQWNTTPAFNPGHLLCSPHTVTWNCIYRLTWAKHDFRLGLDSLKTTFLFVVCFSFTALHEWKYVHGFAKGFVLLAAGGSFKPPLSISTLHLTCEEDLLPLL